MNDGWGGPVNEFPPGMLVRHIRTGELAKVEPPTRNGKVTVRFETPDGRSWEDDLWEITPTKLIPVPVELA